MSRMVQRSSSPQPQMVSPSARRRNHRPLPGGSAGSSGRLGGGLARKHLARRASANSSGPPPQHDYLFRALLPEEINHASSLFRSHHAGNARAQSGTFRRSDGPEGFEHPRRILLPKQPIRLTNSALDHVSSIIPTPKGNARMQYDLIIRNGTVVDGTRLPRFKPTSASRMAASGR